MTKEELEKTEEYDLIIRFKSNKPKYEIRDYIIKHTLNEFDNLQMWDFKRSSEFAKPREKQIEIDAEQIRALQKQNGELTDKVKELEAQIEKMKCWCNCKNYLSCLEECCRKNISFEKGICYNCKKWELRR